MGVWRFYVLDAVTGTVRDELPFGSVTVTDRLNAPGAFTATIANRHPKATPANLDTATTLVVFERDGVLVGGGVLLDANLAPGASEVALGGEGLFNLLRRRLLRGTAGMSHADPFGAASDQRIQFTGVDQFRIVADLVAHAQAQTGGDLGIVVTGTPTLSGVTRDRTDYEVDDSVGALIEQLAAVDNGFDWWLGPTGTIDDLVWRLELDYPRRGRTTGYRFDVDSPTPATSTTLAAETGDDLLLDDGTPIRLDTSSVADPTRSSGSANVLGWGLVESSRDLTTRFVATGAGEGSAKVRRAASDPNLIDVYPLVEARGAWSTVSRPGTLTDHARRRLALDSRPARVPQLVVRADAEPALGAYIVGDTVDVAIDDGWAQIDGPHRIIGRTINVDAAGAETVTLELAELGRFTT